jgi:hypothetical protein
MRAVNPQRQTRKVAHVVMLRSPVSVTNAPRRQSNFDGALPRDSSRHDVKIRSPGSEGRSPPENK